MSEIQSINQTPHIVRYSGMPPRSGPAGPAGPGLTGRDIMRILRKRMWFIIIPTIVFTIMAVLFTAILLRYAPKYTAKAYLAVRPPSTSPMARGGNPMYSTDIIERIVMTNAQMVKSEAVLERAIKMPKVTNTDWYKKDTTGAIERLEEAIGVSGIPNTNLILVTMTASQEDEVADIATALAEAYVDNTRDMTMQANTATISTLTEEMNDLSQKLTRLRNEKVRQRGTAELADIQGRRGTQSAMLQMLSQQVGQMALAKSGAQAALDVLEEQLKSGSIRNSADVVQRVERDPRIQGLRQTQLNLTVRLDVIMEKFGQEHRQVKSIRSQLSSVGDQLKEREKTLIIQQIGFMSEMRRSTLASISEQQVRLQEQYNGVAAKVRDMDAGITRIVELEAEERAVTANLNAVDDRLRELRLLAQNVRPVWLRAPAVTPREPSWPKYKVWVPVGVVLGLLLGTGLAFALEFMDTSIKTPGDISRRIDLAILGMVPHADDLEEEIEDVRTSVMDNSSSLIARAFRQIRTCLLFSAPVERRRSVLITSALPEDGRTTVTLNLASSIALSGHKVLIVDVNFRQPMLSRLFANDEEPPAQGLSNVLVGRLAWQDTVKEIRPNLHLMPSGPLGPNPGELLGSDRMREILAEMVEQYDQVLLDGPPTLVVTDAAILSTIVDGVVLVVRAAVNTDGVVRRMKNILGRINAHILGVVLNGMRITAGGYLRKNYATFYEYQEQDQLLEVDQEA